MREPELAWIFRPVPPDGALRAGELAAMSFDVELGTFVREVLQNSLDARAGAFHGDSCPVRVRFRLLELRGPTKRAFLEACRWRELEPHLEAASRRRGDLGDGLRAARAPRTPLRVLVVEDEHAVGLGGPERGERGRFPAFVRNSLFSDKAGESAGGSYGLGKAVLWTQSALSTILVHSCPIDEERRLESARFIGISQLPSHEIGQGGFDGPGWLGTPRTQDGGRWSASLHDPPAALLEPLALSRTHLSRSGTTLVVPAFRPLLEEDVTEVAQRIREAALDDFWPVLGGASPRMLVEIETPEGRSRVDPRGDPDLVSLLHLAALDPSDALAPDTVRGHEALKIPAVRACAQMEGLAVHSAMEVAEAIEVAAVAHESLSGRFLDRMALLRGSGMVVARVKLRADRPVVAIARAGTALGPERPHRLVEEFLRAAEPPSHNDWSGGAPNLGRLYERGGKTQLQGLKRRLRIRALELIRSRDRPGRRVEVPAALRKALSVGTGRQPGPHDQPGRFDFAVEACRLEQRGSELGWAFEGWAHSSRPGAWRLLVRCRLGAGEDAEPLRLRELEVASVAIVKPKRPVPVPGAERVTVRGFAPVGDLEAVARDAMLTLEMRRMPAQRKRE